MTLILVSGVGGGCCWSPPLLLVALLLLVLFTLAELLDEDVVFPDAVDELDVDDLVAVVDFACLALQESKDEFK